MSRPRKQFCPNGHDTDVEGRRNGYCVLCHRERRNTRARVRCRERATYDLPAGHSAFGTCDDNACGLHGRCHCSPSCERAVKTATRSYSVARIRQGNPMMYAIGHSPRGDMRRELAQLSDHPNDVAARKLISDLADDLTLADIADASGLTVEEIAHISSGKAGTVYAAERLRAAYRAHMGITNTMLPSAPLRPLLRRAIAQRDNQIASLTNGTMSGGIRQFAREYAERFGITMESAERLISRVMRQDFVSLDIGDRFACLIGLHPSLVWPVEWSA